MRYMIRCSIIKVDICLYVRFHREILESMCSFSEHKLAKAAKGAINNASTSTLVVSWRNKF
ncbi:hypothetical protein RchiOBHm_Chr2g0097841 [Rosa chinensis]|uniref:Uncharacterized protein n=1 Tax=Rosa chinensis TaxID=74649 RepID=A0A2P6RLH2_ROSCH|nr:hypothetical protein RchiOBHm_Chr2g0097841 [Rosa chinensis]